MERSADKVLFSMNFLSSVLFVLVQSLFGLAFRELLPVVKYYSLFTYWLRCPSDPPRARLKDFRVEAIHGPERREGPDRGLA